MLDVEDAAHPERVARTRAAGKGGILNERFQVDADEQIDTVAISVGEPRVERPAAELPRRREDRFEPGERRAVDGRGHEVVV
ncbi:MAG: hypothetical protein IPP07_29165 [Holophagales bacterium]|nr:hypothetical protein [Holophagales bacterium]